MIRLLSVPQVTREPHAPGTTLALTSSVRLPLLFIVLILLSLPAPLSALVVDPTQGEITLQTGVGRWNGSTAVAISPRWVLSVQHIPASPGIIFHLDGEQYESVEVHYNVPADLALIKVDRDMHIFNRLSARAPVNNEIVTVGGWGRLRGLPRDGGGWNLIPTEYNPDIPYVPPWGLRHGQNRITVHGATLRMNFSSPSDSSYVPYEAHPVVNDSGSAVMVPGPSGSLEVIGIIRSSNCPLSAPWGCPSSGANLSSSEHQDWIRSIAPEVLPLQCPADFDTDGQISTTDLFLYLSAFMAGHPSADLDESGQCSIEDLFLFLHYFFSGC